MAEQAETRAEVFTPHVIAALRGRVWPGNVRELRHVVDRAILFARVHGVTAARVDLLKAAEGPSLNAPECDGGATQRVAGRDLPPSLRAAQGDWDDDLLKDALEAAHGVIPEAARLLGVSRAQTYRLYKRLKAETRGQTDAAAEPITPERHRGPRPPAPDGHPGVPSSPSEPGC